MIQTTKGEKGVRKEPARNVPGEGEQDGEKLEECTRWGRRDHVEVSKAR